MVTINGSLHLPKELKIVVLIEFIVIIQVGLYKMNNVEKEHYHICIGDELFVLMVNLQDFKSIHGIETM